MDVGGVALLYAVKNKPFLRNGNSLNKFCFGIFCSFKTHDSLI